MTCLSSFCPSYFLQPWQSYEKEVWNKGCFLLDPIVTGPPSAPTLSCIFGLYKVHEAEREIEPEESEDFSLFCRKVLKRGGYGVILAELFINDIWISTLNKAGLIIMPYPYSILYDTGTVPNRHISGFPKNIAQ